MRIPVVPVGKPRMTQRDRWKKRPAVMRYRAFCDELRLFVKSLPDEVVIDFYLPMPKSWSEAKRRRMDGKPHQQKPDADNLIKAAIDAVCEEDKQVWSIHARKFWATEGYIVLHRAADSEIS